MRVITRPALRYYGGKWRMAHWVIAHFPAHKNYVEPCGGSAAVLLQKRRSDLETFNDLDGRIVNFFRVLRSRPDDLVREIKLTPWARAEYALSLEPTDDPLESARRTWVACWMSIGGKGGGWRVITDVSSRHGSTWPGDNLKLDHLLEVAARFAKVQIENTGALDCIARYSNRDALIYFDPPYPVATRERAGRYECDMTDAEHVAAAELLRQSPAHVVVSGYACPLYTELYERHGWKRQDRPSATNSGGRRVESIWLAPRTWEAF